MFRETRWRLVAWNVAVFAIVLAALGATAYTFFASRIYSEVDQELTNEQNSVIRKLPVADYSPPYLFRYNAVVEAPYRAVVTGPEGLIDASSECPEVSAMNGLCSQGALKAASESAIGDVLQKARALPPPPASQPPSQQTVVDIRNAGFRGQTWRVLTFAVVYGGSVQGMVQIARSAAGEETALQQMRLLLILGGLLGILLAAFGSLFLAGKALIPLRKAFNRQRQFTADASHELRTPLSLIRANAEMLCRDAERLPEGDPELVNEIVQETDHLNRLVGDLLTLARADADSLKLVLQPVDFRALVAEVHDDLQHVAEARGIGTSISLDGAVVVQGDEVRLRQLLLILLDNALKYTDSGGRVDISVRQVDNHATLIVADTGIGIPEGDIPHIFERFYRVDQAREHQSGGTGLGLAIAQWIVQAHHGTIRVDSEAGRGARFQVELPA